MKKSVLLVVSLLFVFAAISFAFAAKGPTGKFAGKAGDTIYVCGCGESCDCGSISNKEGKCGCGKDMVKTTVDKVENGKVFYKLDGKELSAPATGKFACGCGDGCNCGSISQKAGKCGCGKDMVKVKKTKK
jgi:hypothetical protein